MTELKARKRRGKKIGMTSEEQAAFFLIAKKLSFKSKREIARFLGMSECGFSLASSEKTLRLPKYLLEFFILKLKAKVEVLEAAEDLEERKESGEPAIQDEELQAYNGI